MRVPPKLAFLFGLFSATATIAPIAITGWAAEPSKADLNNRLKVALVEFQKELGTLEPWQKKVFDEEVVPQFQRFIRDYRAAQSSTQVDIDSENLKNYLRFYAPKVLQRQSPQILVVLKTDASCAKCGESFEEIKNLVRERLERRGLVPVWMALQDLGEVGKLKGKDLEEGVAALAQDKQAVGVLVHQWNLAPNDPNDTAHADEHRYQIRSFLSLRDISRHPGQVEILEPENFGKSTGRLLTDFFTDLGAKVERIQATQGDPGKDEYLVEVIGIRDFSQYALVKEAVLTRLQSSPGIRAEEQRISRGRVGFAVFSSKGVEDLKAQISGLAVGSNRLALIQADAQVIQMEIR